MTISNIILYILSAVILIGGVLSVTARKIFRAAIYMLVSLSGIAGLYFYMEYEFLGAIQIVVYVGGIVVLILFSIFLTHEAGADMKRPRLAQAVFVGLAASFACALTLLFLNEWVFVPDTATPVEASVKQLGRQMLSTTEYGYVLPFEMVSMLLLAAMVGCIVIAIKVRADETSTQQTQS